jgi:alpha-N-arabinofuranosidase
MNRIKIDPQRVIGTIDRNIFGGFAEQLGRCIYGGIYEPGSPLADRQGFRKDVLGALKLLTIPFIEKAVAASSHRQTNGFHRYT